MEGNRSIWTLSAQARVFLGLGRSLHGLVRQSMLQITNLFRPKSPSFFLLNHHHHNLFKSPNHQKIVRPFTKSPKKMALITNQQKPLEIQRDVLDEAIEGWKGELEQVDDICIIGIRV